MKPRNYQLDLSTSTLALWGEHRVVLLRLDTGGGKTVILSYLCGQITGFIAGIAHRDKLVEQMSLTLGRSGIHHDVVASDKAVKAIIKKHIRKLGKSFIRVGSGCKVASVKTLIGRPELAKWAAQVKLWIVDEGHHVVKDNQWGKAVELFTHPDCRGLLLTATPKRGDKKGLGRHRAGCNGGPCEGCNDGYADVMIEGPPMRWLIDEGYLCDYDVVCPISIRASEAPRGKDGDYTDNQRKEATQDRQIIGNIADNYLKYGQKRSAVAFAGNVEDATDIVAELRARGVSAELITGKTDITIRDDIFDRSEKGKLDVVVAVDVISEGVDIPALIVGIFARLTGSLPLWIQQVGRLLRPIYAPGFDLETREGRLAAIAASPKPRALLIDHTGAFVNPALGPPDKQRVWDLEPGSRRGDEEDDDPEEARRICSNPTPVIPKGHKRTCNSCGYFDEPDRRPDGKSYCACCSSQLPREEADTICNRPTARLKRACEHCGHIPEPASRGGPEYVEGDLALMDPAELAKLQGRALVVGLSRAQHGAAMIAKGVPSVGIGKQWSYYLDKCEALEELHASMDLWAGAMHGRGLADHEIQRAFWISFGLDVLTPSTLAAADMRALKIRVDAAVNRV